MNKVCKFIVMLLILFSADAFGETKMLGYCAGENAQNSLFTVEGNKNVSGAIFLPPEMLMPYDGCLVKAIRVALTSKINIDKVTVWTRASLDGENISEFTITSSSTPSIAKGWLECPLDPETVINSGDGLYVGMTYHQKAKASIFSLVGSGFENSFYVKTSDDSEWEDMHSVGLLSIEAVVETQSSFDYDLALIHASVDSSSSSNSNLVTVKVANMGLQTIEGFTLSTYTALDPSAKKFHTFPISMKSGDKMEVVCSIDKDLALLSNPPIVEIESLNNGVDEFEGNNRIEAKVNFSKRILVEEFTTELCGNCPREAGYIHEVTSEPEYEGKVSVICHHAGFYTDWLTQPCDAEIGWLYGCDFAPAVMFDRRPINGKMAICPSKSELRTNFDANLELVPSTGIIIIPDYDSETRTLEVTVSTSRDNNIISNPCLSVYLVEDGIQCLNQAGADPDYLHNHVIRAYNSTWGDPMEWNGVISTANYTFAIEPDWIVGNMSVIAFVANRNPENKADNKVDNVAEVSLSLSGAGLNAPSESSVSGYRYVDINGHCVSSDTKGILIRIATMSDGSIKTDKILKK